MTPNANAGPKSLADLPPLLTLPLVAQFAQVSFRTARRWVDEELLPSYRTPSGQRVLVKREDLLRLLGLDEEN